MLLCDSCSLSVFNALLDVSRLTASVSSRLLQPPLQYYLHAFTAKDWDEIKVVSAYSEDKTVNPVFKALEVMNTAGALGPNVGFYRVSKTWRCLSRIVIGQLCNRQWSSLNIKGALSIV